MKITNVLQNHTIQTLIEVNDKTHLLNTLLELVNKTGKLLNKEEAMKEILKREQIMSTGVGKGIAIPHAKTDYVEDSVASLVTLSKPIDFDSIDGEPVNIAFLLLGRENNVGNHLRLLSKISRLLNDESFRNKLLKCKNNNEVIELIKENESNGSVIS
jgi:fructose-specific phosphotransferase system IIA component